MITLDRAASISRARIETLKPDFQKKVQDWFLKVCEAGIKPYIYEGFRSPERQHELYMIGRGKPGKIVTNADSYQSFHNYGYAFDWVPLVRVIKGEGLYEADWGNEPYYAVGANIGKQFNLRSISWETPHLEDGQFENWRDLNKKFGNEKT